MLAWSALIRPGAGAPTRSSGGPPSLPGFPVLQQTARLDRCYANRVRPEHRRGQSVMDLAALEKAWAVACALDGPSRRELLARLRFLEEGGAKGRPRTSRERAVAALREAAATLGRSPSAQEYSHLRNEAEMRGEWPSESTIRRVVSTEWAVCLASAILPPSSSSVRTLPARRESSVIALRDAARVFGHSPSQAEYRRLRNQGEHQRWPAAKTIRGVLSQDWSKCLALAGLTPSPQARRPFSHEELISALQACARDTGISPSLATYSVWARASHPTSVRVPTSQGPFERAFGSWVNALVAAGLRQGNSVPQQRATRDDLQSVRASDEACLEAVRAAARVLGHTPTSAEYIRYRRGIAAANDRVARRGALSYDQLNRRFGGWSTVIECAGLGAKARS